MQFLEVIAICAIYLLIFVMKPGWCYSQKMRLDEYCSYDYEEETVFFSIQKILLSLNQSEMLSWFLMIFLIMYDITVEDTKARHIMVYGLLFIFDIVLGFLYLNGIIELKVN